MKNSLEDVGNHLIEQLEVLKDRDIKGDDLKEEIARAGAMSTLVGKLIDAGELALEASRLELELGPQFTRLPKLLGLDGRRD